MVLNCIYLLKMNLTIVINKFLLKKMLYNKIKNFKKFCLRIFVGTQFTPYDECSSTIQVFGYNLVYILELIINCDFSMTFSLICIIFINCL